LRQLDSLVCVAENGSVAIHIANGDIGGRAFFVCRAPRVGYFAPNETAIETLPELPHFDSED